MQTRFRYPTRKISDVGVLRISPLLLLFPLLIYPCYGFHIQKKDRASLAVPSLDLYLTQVLPFGIPTVLFEMRLLNPRIGNFTGRLKGDVVTAQCVEKFGLQFQ